ncbi:hypothetical protein DASC09_008600 [Saccharomycopsis crataegensis]|uniref:Zn(2)-C6 fungal-type domain-containing protein n=1 Tax=Saccharomycopsis crataegensis TaxID=43959 RepID=A0AAV5QF05_9ASCO|nr:hypothetical protein DASC09_008600 [Saccharomycopsis crataegensis]
MPLSDFSPHASEQEHNLIEEKRRVARRACLNCRKKKIKCDGELHQDGKCTRCRNLDLPCEFIASLRGGRRKKRNLEDDTMSTISSNNGDHLSRNDSEINNRASHIPSFIRSNKIGSETLLSDPLFMKSSTLDSDFRLGQMKSPSNYANLDNLDNSSTYSPTIDSYRDEFTGFQRQHPQQKNLDPPFDDEKVKAIVDSRLQERFFDGSRASYGRPYHDHGPFKHHHDHFDDHHHPPPPPFYGPGPSHHGHPGDRDRFEHFGHFGHFGPHRGGPGPGPGSNGAPGHWQHHRFHEGPPPPPPGFYPPNMEPFPQPYKRHEFDSPRGYSNESVLSGGGKNRSSRFTNSSDIFGKPTSEALSESKSSSVSSKYDKDMPATSNNNYKGYRTFSNNGTVISKRESTSNSLLSLTFTPRILKLFDMPPLEVIEKLFDLYYIYANPRTNALPNSKELFLLQEIHKASFPEKCSSIFAIFATSCSQLDDEDYNDPEYWLRLVAKYWKYQTNSIESVFFCLSILIPFSFSDCSLQVFSSGKEFDFLNVLNQTSILLSKRCGKIFANDGENGFEAVLDSAKSLQEVVKVIQDINSIWNIWITQSFFKLLTNCNDVNRTFTHYNNGFVEELPFPIDVPLPTPTSILLKFYDKVYNEPGGFQKFYELSITQKKQYLYNEFESKSKLTYFRDLEMMLENKAIIQSSAVLILLLKLHCDIVDTDSEHVKDSIAKIKALESIYFKEYNSMLRIMKNDDIDMSLIGINSHFLLSKLVILNSKFTIFEFSEQEILPVRPKAIFKLIKKANFNHAAESSTSMINQKLHILKSQILPKISGYSILESVKTYFSSNATENFINLIDVVSAAFELDDIIKLGQGIISSNGSKQHTGYQSVVALEDDKAIDTMISRISDINEDILLKRVNLPPVAPNSIGQIADCWTQYPMITDVITLRYGVIIASTLLLSSQLVFRRSGSKYVIIQRFNENELATIDLVEMGHTLPESNFLTDRLFNERELIYLLDSFCGFLKYRCEKVSWGNSLLEYYAILNEIKEYGIGFINTGATVNDEEEW